MIKPGSLVFDIGAHKGEQTGRYLQAGSLVVAVEPQRALSEALKFRYQDNPRLTTVAKACGAHAGMVDLHITVASWLATCCPEKWRQGRFNGYYWNNLNRVEMTTLDALIEEFGLPDFIKIDVEGYEGEVLSGLTQAVPALCYEFTIEFLEDAEKCAEQLLELGEYEFAVAIGNHTEPGEYMRPEILFGELRARQTETLLWGDIYARRANP
jgi:FkbM family methyltransferase